MQRKIAIAAAAVMSVGVVSVAEARDEIRVVGSSTVFPFTSTVIERFAQASGGPAPIIESTGTGGGMKLFCAGVGEEHPDFTGASRPIKDTEKEMCVENGVAEVTEMIVGFDGIVFANSNAGPSIELSKAQLFAALAKEVEVNGEVVANPYTKWSEIDASLPDSAIEVLGPPPTSGTRDAFVELVMEVGCEEYPAIAALEEERMEAVCATMREDGAFIEAGENDNLIVQRLDASPDAFGIFGFSFLEENLDKLKGATIGGVEPTFDNIASGEYGVSRSLFLYIKNAHRDVIPGMNEFIAEYASDKALGPEGYLVDIGLIPLPEAERAEMRSNVLNAANIM